MVKAELDGKQAWGGALRLDWVHRGCSRVGLLGPYKASGRTSSMLAKR